MREGVKPVEVGEEDREEGEERERGTFSGQGRLALRRLRASDARTHQQQSMGATPTATTESA